jgi:hypothetical protein
MYLHSYLFTLTYSTELLSAPAYPVDFCILYSFHHQGQRRKPLLKALTIGEVHFRLLKDDMHEV